MLSSSSRVWKLKVEEKKEEGSSVCNADLKVSTVLLVRIHAV